MNLDNLSAQGGPASGWEKVLEGEPKYRVGQARDAVYKNFISNWDEATFFSKELRDKLNAECPLEIKADVLVSEREDSVKARITLADGLIIETVMMRHEDGRNTVCVSCQVGCPLGCLFCATGKMGFKRNLTSDEIIEQVIFFDRYLKNFKIEKLKNCVTNVTYMGMGEPFLNYDNVLESVKILNDHKYFNIGVRSISVSTAGIIEGIEKLSKEPLHINLAISLHAPNNKLRGELMPINKKYPLKEVLKAVDNYIEKTKRKVMFEYVLIKGINDSGEHAKELAKIMGGNKLYFVNLILYNETHSTGSGQAGIYKASDTKRVKEFRAILEKLNIRYTQRHRFGDDINAACGQFVTNNNKQEKHF
jgi:23S rRNA (adenine2503-C2)-methyltransferase